MFTSPLVFINCASIFQMDVLALQLMEEFVESTEHMLHYAVQRDVQMLLRNMDYVNDMVHMILL